MGTAACQREPVALDAGAPIVLVVIDTLRADALGVYGSAHATSPALDAWAKRGAVFERAFSTSPWTLPSVGSLLTGRFPSGHGSGRGKLALADGRSRRVFIALDGSVPRLASIVSQHGYATAAFVTNTFLRPGFGVADGFDTYDHMRNRYVDERRADVMIDRALGWIDQRRQGEPWLLLVHLLDPHQPYDPPPAEAGRFTAGYQGSLHAPIGPDSGLVRKVKRGEIELDAADQAFLRGVYDEEVAFVAAQIARLLDGLAARKVLERGLVIVTADHGEEFLDHGALEHGHTLYQELLHVPLLVWGPHVRAGRHPEPVSQVDVLPTVLDALGIAPPRESRRRLAVAAAHRPRRARGHARAGGREQPLRRSTARPRRVALQAGDRRREREPWRVPRLSLRCSWRRGRRVRRRALRPRARSGRARQPGGGAARGGGATHRRARAPRAEAARSARRSSSTPTPGASCARSAICADRDDPGAAAATTAGRRAG